MCFLETWEVLEECGNRKTRLDFGNLRWFWKPWGDFGNPGDFGNMVTFGKWGTFGELELILPKSSSIHPTNPKNHINPALFGLS